VCAPRPEWAATGRWAERIATVSGAWDRSADGAPALTYFTVIQATTMIFRLQLRLALALSASFVHVLTRLNDPRAKDEAERLDACGRVEGDIDIVYTIRS